MCALVQCLRGFHQYARACVYFELDRPFNQLLVALFEQGRKYVDFVARGDMTEFASETAATMGLGSASSGAQHDAYGGDGVADLDGDGAAAGTNGGLAPPPPRAAMLDSIAWCEGRLLRQSVTRSPSQGATLLSSREMMRRR